MTKEPVTKEHAETALKVKKVLDATESTLELFKEMLDISITTCQGEGASDQAAKYMTAYNNIQIWLNEKAQANLQEKSKPNPPAKTKPSRTKPTPKAKHKKSRKK